MIFHVRPGLILYQDHQPGNCVAMHGPNGALAKVDAECRADDAACFYLWAFALPGPLADGQEFVFSTTDRSVRGIASGGQVRIATTLAPPAAEPWFERRPGFVVFHDSRPGSLVQMATDGRGLPPHGGEFSDAERRYAWLFEYHGEVVEGQQFVFSATDREVIGEFKDGKIGIVPARRSRALHLAAPSTLRAAAKPADHAARCLFVNPSIPYGQWACYKAGVMNEASFSSHGMAYVSAALKSVGHKCSMIDFRTHQNWDDVRRTIAAAQYDVAFVGFLSIDVFSAAAAVRLLKEAHPNRPVVVGGLHVSIAKEPVFPRADLVDYYCWSNHDLLPGSFWEFLRFKGEDRYFPERYPQADYVILDDGEVAARALVAELAAGRRPPGRTIAGGAVPMEVARHMDRDLFDLSTEANSPILPFQPTPMVTVTWARGCPFKCRYCNLSSQISNANVRTKTPELIREELQDLHQRFGGRIGSLMIHDDLTFHTKAIADWCETILKESPTGIPIWLQTRAGMVGKWYRKDRPFFELLCRAGLTWASVGYESGSQRVLDYMNKDSTVEENIECGRILDEYGINSFGNFLWGTYGENNDEAEQTVDLVKKIKPGFLSGSIYCSYPGTAEDRHLRENNLLVPGQVYTRSHLPWQYTVKGIDYAHRADCISRAGAFSNYLRMPKLLHKDRQSDLAATARGLPIHSS